MRFLPRLLILVGLAYLCVVLFREGKRIEATDTADHTQLILVFGGALLSAIVGGIILAVTFLPILGEKMGQIIYGTADDEAHDPFFMAREAIGDGDYMEAISYYRQALAADPDDTAALEGIADVQAKYLEKSDDAAELLEAALEKRWPTDEETFLRCKLAEIYGRYQGDMPKARALLLDTMTAHPDTKHSRNAEHVLHELEAA